MKKTLTSIILSFSLLLTQAQNADLTHLPGNWKASWISCPNIDQRGYGVYHFRKILKLADKPANYIVHVSADNRYRLFVNGKSVCAGPARGDLYNWNFETIDLAPYLRAGNNIIAALVWNMGEFAAVAQVSNQTGFLLQSSNDKNDDINTNKSWKVYKDSAFTPCSTDNGERLRTYMVIGPGDSVNAAAYPWQWETLDYNDSNWSNAREVTNAVMVGYGSDNLWSLSPRTIPLMEETPQRMQVIRRTKGIQPDPAFLKGESPLEIPAHSKVSILLDQQYNSVCYPELMVNNGKNAQIKLTYAEALFDKEMHKGNRNEIDGKEIVGNYDVFIADGGKRLFRPLWQRTYRYLQLDIETKDAPLTIVDLRGMANGYPFKENASFDCSDSSLKNIWNVGWRTARLCAGETYFDCPYYEQLQYEADTRIQALISLYVSGDDRLMRKAIHDFYISRVPEGLTQGRYPSSRIQVIPTFSLYWISMLYDYWMYRNDTTFVKQYLSAVRGVLDWYEAKIDEKKNMLGPMRWWNFEDWNNSFPGGVPDGANDGNSSLVTLHYVYTLQQAAALFNFFGKTNEAAQYTALATRLSNATYKLCFDGKRNVMANTPEMKTFSQHASIMGVLSGAIPSSQQKAVMQKVLTDESLSQATFFYRFYLNQALKKAGMGDAYYSQLTPWRNMLAMGLTTFAENPDPTRSDCHAWSASPNYDFLATICGIEPASFGFAKVKIEPHLGELQWANGVLPHPKGNLSVSLKRKGANGIDAAIDLPKGVTGDFIWNGKTVKLKEGRNTVVL
ncbi:alpha-rhamnosidase [Chitinophagaceae bacterium 26-R-25]|nr:alpha-rhamnosidase [Chitinophagaceae bacterium 26-R-25]